MPQGQRILPSGYGHQDPVTGTEHVVFLDGPADLDVDVTEEAGLAKGRVVTADLDRLLWIESTAKESRPFREALRNCLSWPTDPRPVPVFGEQPGEFTVGVTAPEVDPLVAETVRRIQSLP